MSSLGVFVAVVGVTSGVISILLTTFFLYSERQARSRKLKAVENAKPQPQLETENQGIDETIGSFTVHDYVSSPKVYEKVNEYLRPLRDLRQLKDLLEKETEQGHVHLRQAVLSNCKLEGVLLKKADLKGADMHRTNLSGADLSGADLSGANLKGANLQGADLTDADLNGTRGITNKELEKQAKSLKGATMPDGSKHV